MDVNQIVGQVAQIAMDSLENKSDDVQMKRREIRKTLLSVINGDLDSRLFYQTILDSITVFRSKNMELRLKELPHIFCFRE